MNKIQDGFYAGGDSYKPLIITSDRQHVASLSFVGDQIIIRPLKGAKLELVHSEGNLAFKIISEAAEPAEPEPA